MRVADWRATTSFALLLQLQQAQLAAAQGSGWQTADYKWTVQGGPLVPGFATDLILATEPIGAAPGVLETWGPSPRISLELIGPNSMIEVHCTAVVHPPLRRYSLPGVAPGKALTGNPGDMWFNVSETALISADPPDGEYAVCVTLRTDVDTPPALATGELCVHGRESVRLASGSSAPQECASAAAGAAAVLTGAELPAELAGVPATRTRAWIQLHRPDSSVDQCPAGMNPFAARRVAAGERLDTSRLHGWTLICVYTSAGLILQLSQRLAVLPLGRAPIFTESPLVLLPLVPASVSLSINSAPLGSVPTGCSPFVASISASARCSHAEGLLQTATDAHFVLAVPAGPDGSGGTVCFRAPAPGRSCASASDEWDAEWFPMGSFVRRALSLDGGTAPPPQAEFHQAVGFIPGLSQQLHVSRLDRQAMPKAMLRLQLGGESVNDACGGDPSQYALMHKRANVLGTQLVFSCDTCISTAAHNAALCFAYGGGTWQYLGLRVSVVTIQLLNATPTVFTDQMDDRTLTLTFSVNGSFDSSTSSQGTLPPRKVRAAVYAPDVPSWAYLAVGTSGAVASLPVPGLVVSVDAARVVVELQSRNGARRNYTLPDTFPIKGNVEAYAKPYRALDRYCSEDRDLCVRSDQANPGIVGALVGVPLTLAVEGSWRPGSTVIALSATPGQDLGCSAVQSGRANISRARQSRDTVVSFSEGDLTQVGLFTLCKSQLGPGGQTSTRWEPTGFRVMVGPAPDRISSTSSVSADLVGNAVTDGAVFTINRVPVEALVWFRLPLSPEGSADTAYSAESMPDTWFGLFRARCDAPCRGDACAPMHEAQLTGLTRDTAGRFAAVANLFVPAMRALQEVTLYVCTAVVPRGTKPLRYSYVVSQSLKYVVTPLYVAGIEAIGPSRIEGGSALVQLGGIPQVFPLSASADSAAHPLSAVWTQGLLRFRGMGNGSRSAFGPVQAEPAGSSSLTMVTFPALQEGTYPIQVRVFQSAADEDSVVAWTLTHLRLRVGRIASVGGVEAGHLGLPRAPSPEAGDMPVRVRTNLDLQTGTSPSSSNFERSQLGVYYVLSAGDIDGRDPNLPDCAIRWDDAVKEGVGATMAPAHGEGHVLTFPVERLAVANEQGFRACVLLRPSDKDLVAWYQRADIPLPWMSPDVVIRVVDVTHIDGRRSDEPITVFSGLQVRLSVGCEGDITCVHLRLAPQGQCAGQSAGLGDVWLPPPSDTRWDLHRKQWLFEFDTVDPSDARRVLLPIVYDICVGYAEGVVAFVKVHVAEVSVHDFSFNTNRADQTLYIPAQLGDPNGIVTWDVQVQMGEERVNLDTFPLWFNVRPQGANGEEGSRCGFPASEEWESEQSGVSTVSVRVQQCSKALELRNGDFANQSTGGRLHLCFAYGVVGSGLSCSSSVCQPPPETHFAWTGLYYEVGDPRRIALADEPELRHLFPAFGFGPPVVAVVTPPPVVRLFGALGTNVSKLQKDLVFLIDTLVCPMHGVISCIRSCLHGYADLLRARPDAPDPNCTWKCEEASIHGCSGSTANWVWAHSTSFGDENATASGQRRNPRATRIITKDSYAARRGAMVLGPSRDAVMPSALDQECMNSNTSTSGNSSQDANVPFLILSAKFHTWYKLRIQVAGEAMRPVFTSPIRLLACYNWTIFNGDADARRRFRSAAREGDSDWTLTRPDHGTASQEQCTAPPLPYYAVPGESVCKPCPTGAVCDGTTEMRTDVLNGVPYWRADITSTKFYSCDVEGGGTQGCVPYGPVGACAKEYRPHRFPFHPNPLCTLCADGHGKANRRNVCAPCADPAETWAWAMFLALVILVYVGLSVRSNIRLSSKAKSYSKFSILSRMLMSHMQMVSLIGRFYDNLVVLKQIRTGSDVVTGTAIDPLLSLDCIVQYDYYQRFEKGMRLPLILLAFVVGILVPLLALARLYGVYTRKKEGGAPEEGKGRGAPRKEKDSDPVRRAGRGVPGSLYRGRRSTVRGAIHRRSSVELSGTVSIMDVAPPDEQLTYTDAQGRVCRWSLSGSGDGVALVYTEGTQLVCKNVRFVGYDLEGMYLQVDDRILSLLNIRDIRGVLCGVRYLAHRAGVECCIPDIVDLPIKDVSQRRHSADRTPRTLSPRLLLSPRAATGGEHKARTLFDAVCADSDMRPGARAVGREQLFNGLRRIGAEQRQRPELWGTLQHFGLHTAAGLCEVWEKLGAGEHPGAGEGARMITAENFERVLSGDCEGNHMHHIHFDCASTAGNAAEASDDGVGDSAVRDTLAAFDDSGSEADSGIEDDDVLGHRLGFGVKTLGQMIRFAGAVIFVSFFLVYAHILKLCADMLTCTNIDWYRYENGTVATRELLSVDLSIDCTEDKYHQSRGEAIAYFSSYGLGLPAAFVSLNLFMRYGHTMCTKESEAAAKHDDQYQSLARWKKERRQQLANYRARIVFGFLTAGYRQERWYWEAFVMVRKLLAAVVAHSGLLSVETMRAYVLMWVLILFSGVQTYFAPYELPLLNRLEQCSLFTLALTVGLILLHQEYVAPESTDIVGDTAESTLFSYLVVVLVCLNGGCILFFIRHLLDNAYLVVLHSLLKGVISYQEGKDAWCRWLRDRVGRRRPVTLLQHLQRGSRRIHREPFAVMYQRDETTGMRRVDDDQKPLLAVLASQTYLGHQHGGTGKDGELPSLRDKLVVRRHALDESGRASFDSLRVGEHVSFRATPGGAEPGVYLGEVVAIRRGRTERGAAVEAALSVLRCCTVWYRKCGRRTSQVAAEMHAPEIVQLECRGSGCEALRIGVPKPKAKRWRCCGRCDSGEQRPGQPRRRLCCGRAGGDQHHQEASPRRCCGRGRSKPKEQPVVRVKYKRKEWDDMRPQRSVEYQHLLADDRPADVQVGARVVRRPDWCEPWMQPNAPLSDANGGAPGSQSRENHSVDSMTRTDCPAYLTWFHTEGDCTRSVPCDDNIGITHEQPVWQTEDVRDQPRRYIYLDVSAEEMMQLREGKAGREAALARWVVSTAEATESGPRVRNVDAPGALRSPLFRIFAGDYSARTYCRFPHDSCFHGKWEVRGEERWSPALRSLTLTVECFAGSVEESLGVSLHGLRIAAVQPDRLVATAQVPRVHGWLPPEPVSGQDKQQGEPPVFFGDLFPEQSGRWAVSAVQVWQDITTVADCSGAFEQASPEFRVELRSGEGEMTKTLEADSNCGDLFTSIGAVSFDGLTVAQVVPGGKAAEEGIGKDWKVARISTWWYPASRTELETAFSRESGGFRVVIAEVGVCPSDDGVGTVAAVDSARETARVRWEKHVLLYEPYEQFGHEQHKSCGRGRWREKRDDFAFVHRYPIANDPPKKSSLWFGKHSSDRPRALVDIQIAAGMRRETGSWKVVANTDVIPSEQVTHLAAHVRWWADGKHQMNRDKCMRVVVKQVFKGARKRRPFGMLPCARSDPAEVNIEYTDSARQSAARIVYEETCMRSWESCCSSFDPPQPAPFDPDDGCDVEDLLCDTKLEWIPSLHLSKLKVKKRQHQIEVEHGTSRVPKGSIILSVDGEAMRTEADLKRCITRWADSDVHPVQGLSLQLPVKQAKGFNGGKYVASTDLLKATARRSASDCLGVALEFQLWLPENEETVKIRPIRWQADRLPRESTSASDYLIADPDIEHDTHTKLGETEPGFQALVEWLREAQSTPATTKADAGQDRTQSAAQRAQARRERHRARMLQTTSQKDHDAQELRRYLDMSPFPPPGSQGYVELRRCQQQDQGPLDADEQQLPEEYARRLDELQRQLQEADQRDVQNKQDLQLVAERALAAVDVLRRAQEVGAGGGDSEAQLEQDIKDCFAGFDQALSRVAERGAGAEHGLPK
eukprot:TRINITY_DN15594_c0_g1_i2.p1 TRINITY_DN15594_c0_g1~~TRINITY_DN15594_c0_g1_i2.p1  ORF type:complete len:3827 (+),score=557.89 TRINITY_DN15594_c0_g1_i2:91-11571(+)